MSDYTKTINFEAKDALTTGDPNKLAKGTEVDDEFDAIATMSATKADKVGTATNDFVPLFDSNGNLKDSTINANGASGTLWTSGNGGAGSGLDADTVDGNEATAFALAGSEVPTGGIIMWTTATVPTGFLECDGASYDTTAQASLFAVIGYTYGGSASNFNVPDLRGEFVRGFDNGAGNDPDAASRTDRGDGTTGDVVGTKQADELEAHVHGGVQESGSGNAFTIGGFDIQNPGSTDSTGGNETRPRNVQLPFIIKT